jgi:hypothetical protein
MEGYKIAVDPKPWEEEMEAKIASARAEAREAEVDELAEDEEAAEGEEDVDSEGVGKKKKAGAKRKRESVAGEKKKTKVAGEPAKKKKAAATPAKRGKKNGVISSETIESEDDGALDERPSKKRKSSEADSGGACIFSTSLYQLSF